MTLIEQNLFEADEVAHISLEYDITAEFKVSTIQTISLLIKYRLSLAGVPVPEVNIKFIQKNSFLKCYLYISYKTPTFQSERIWDAVYNVISSIYTQSLPSVVVQDLIDSYLQSNINNLLVRSLTSSCNIVAQAYNFSQGSLFVQNYKSFPEQYLHDVTEDCQPIFARLKYLPTRRLVVSKESLDVASGLLPFSEKFRSQQGEKVALAEKKSNKIQIIAKTERPTIVFAISSDSPYESVTKALCQYINIELFSNFRDRYDLYLLIAYRDTISSKVIVIAQAPKVNTGCFNEKLSSEVVKKINLYMENNSQFFLEEVSSRMPINSIVLEQVSTFINYRINKTEPGNIDRVRRDSNKFELFGVGAITNSELTKYTVIAEI